MRVHAARSQHGLAYKMAPLEGKRAPVLIALMSRAPAAHVPFQQLQLLIWQIEGGLSYAELPPESRLLVDQLIPERRNQIGEDFVNALQKSKNVRSWIKNIPGLDKVNAGEQEIDAMIQRYQAVRQTLLRYAGNYDALSRELVNIVPGLAENAGPTTWSELNPRVYARLIGGKHYGEEGTVEIRVLPGHASASIRSAEPQQRVSYNFRDSIAAPVAGNDTADVPLQAMLGYPNDSTMQGLGWTPKSSAGLLVVAELTSLEPDLPLLNKVQNVLMWIDCNAVTSKKDLALYLIQVTGDHVDPGSQQATQWLPFGVDGADVIADGLDAGSLAGLAVDVIEPVLMPQFGLSCDKYNLANTLVDAARQHRVTGTGATGSSPFAPHTIVPGSVRSSAGVITFRESLRARTQETTANLKLTFVPCQSSEIANCAANRQPR